MSAIRCCSVRLVHGVGMLRRTSGALMLDDRDHLTDAALHEAD